MPSHRGDRGADRRGNGGADRSPGRAANDLRHVQGRGPGHDHYRCETTGEAWG